VPIDEASAKIRVGGPIDDTEDLGLNIWAGQLPIELITRPAVPSEKLPDGVVIPDYVTNYPARRTALKSSGKAEA
jgi:hypothetical protein